MTMSKFATIHGGLLARKGEAAPAVRHSDPGLSYSDAPPPPAPRPSVSPMDTAFGDMRTRDPVPPAPCTASNERPERNEPCSRNIPVGDGPGGRVSLRLTERQKRSLMIASAVLGRSQQKMLSDALDRHLERLASGELKACGCFNDQRPAHRVSPG